jgi:DHA3 family macrolide efflux protein-like MFS transporter
MWRILRTRNGLWLWVGRGGAFLGDQLHELILAWLVWDVTKSSTATGIVLFVSHLPFWTLGWLAGVIADRWKRTLVVFHSNAIRAVMALLILVLWDADMLTIVLLAALSFLINLCATIDAPAFHAQIPQLVAPRDFRSVNALADNTKRAGRLAAPILLTAIAHCWAAPTGYLLTAASFAVMSICELFFRPLYAASVAVRRSLADDLKEGWREARKNKPLFRLLLCFALYNPAYGACFYVILPRLMGGDLGGGLDAFNLAVGAYAAGGLIGSMVFGTIAIGDKVKWVYAAFIIVALGFLLLGVAPSIGVAAMICGISALGLPIMDIFIPSLIHEGVSVEHNGKIYALWRYLAEIGIAVGVFCGGPIADYLGTQATLAAFAVSVFLIVAVFVLSQRGRGAR